LGDHTELNEGVAIEHASRGTGLAASDENAATTMNVVSANTIAV